MCIEREREIIKTGKRSIEVTWSLTSLGAKRAGPEELLDLVRNHWHIENRLHYVRDFTCNTQLHDDVEYVMIFLWYSSQPRSYVSIVSLQSEPHWMPSPYQRSTESSTTCFPECN